MSSLRNLHPEAQAEKIADNFVKVSNQYEPLRSEDIDISQSSTSKSVPWITHSDICHKYAK